MKTLYFSFFLLIFSFNSYAQSVTLRQYFDGADTAASNSIIITLDSSGSNVWQIGRPHKAIFDSADTYPNAIVTDTINNYPPNDTSRFTFIIVPHMTWGILALRWAQKLDLVKGHDIAMVEFSNDSGKTWQNAFGSHNVYNFYGFAPSNRDTLPGNVYGFSGTDSAWKDIWLCYDMSYLSTLGAAVHFRFTLISDSTTNKKEGWVIDNMMSGITYVHIVKNTKQTEYLRVYPTNTTGIVSIEAEKLEEFHVIESMQLISSDGKIVEQFGVAPTKTFININGHPDGLYYLRVNTNIKSKTFPVFLKR